MPWHTKYLVLAKQMAIGNDYIMDRFVSFTHDSGGYIAIK